MQKFYARKLRFIESNLPIESFLWTTNEQQQIHYQKSFFMEKLPMVHQERFADLPINEFAESEKKAPSRSCISLLDYGLPESLCTLNRRIAMCLAHAA
jgi:hypothetical protein